MPFISKHSDHKSIPVIKNNQQLPLINNKVVSNLNISSNPKIQNFSGGYDEVKQSALKMVNLEKANKLVIHYELINILNRCKSPTEK